MLLELSRYVCSPLPVNKFVQIKLSDKVKFLIFCSWIIFLKPGWELRILIFQIPLSKQKRSNSFTSICLHDLGCKNIILSDSKLTAYNPLFVETINLFFFLSKIWYQKPHSLQEEHLLL